MRLWASVWDGHERRPLRVGIVVVFAASQAVEAFQVDWQSRDAVRYPPSGELSRVLATAPHAAWILLAVIMVGLLGVLWDRRPILGGVLALLGAGVLSEWQTWANSRATGRQTPFSGADALERLVERAGAKVMSATGAGNGDGPEAALMCGLLDLFAQYERAVIGSRTRAALAVKKAKRERVGGIPFSMPHRPERDR